MGPKVFVCGFRRHHDVVRLVDKFISYFNRQTEVYIKYTSLADVLKLGTSLANLRLFEASCIAVQPGTWFPAENCKWPLADFAFTAKLRP
jgi:hypothetical protein